MGESATLHLLGGPHLSVGRTRTEVPEGGKRLVAYVALHDSDVDRRRAAAALWPDVSYHRAAGNLRSVTWRLRSAGLPVLEMSGSSLALRADVRVDVDDVRAWACRVTGSRLGPGDLDVRPGALQALDLLPGWYDDWVLQKREDLRQVILHAIDALSGLLVAARRYGEAVEAALTAVSAEPLRESAQRALIVAHLAEGNRCEAWRSFGSYQDLLADELGVTPSTELRSLVRWAPTRPDACDVQVASSLHPFPAAGPRRPVRPRPRSERGAARA